jgi:hypothetical protein
MADDDPVDEFIDEFVDDDADRNEEADEDVLEDDDGLMPGSERSPDEIGPGSTASAPPGADDSEADAPLSDLRREVDERRSRSGSSGGRSDDEFEELFAEMEVGDLDADDIWEEFSEDEDPMFETAFVEEDREVTVVEKSLCHGCEHFADPPRTGCTHDGTDIDAEVDTGHFRVMDCPVVAERKEMEASDFSADDE